MLEDEFLADPDLFYDGIGLILIEERDAKDQGKITLYTCGWFKILPGQAAQVNDQTAQAGEFKENSTGIWYQYPDGSYASGWKNIDGKWYFFGDNGYALTGWQMLDGKWYFFYDSGRMRTGYVASKGKPYYMDDKTGAMLVNSTTPDGKKIGPDGVVIE